MTLSTLAASRGRLLRGPCSSIRHPGRLLLAPSQVGLRPLQVAFGTISALFGTIAGRSSRRLSSVCRPFSSVCCGLSTFWKPSRFFLALSQLFYSPLQVVLGAVSALLFTIAVRSRCRLSSRQQAVCYTGHRRSSLGRHARQRHWSARGFTEQGSHPLVLVRQRAQQPVARAPKLALPGRGLALGLGRRLGRALFRRSGR
jgi:hypothetical protein